MLYFCAFYTAFEVNVVIDIGNTARKYGLFDNKELILVKSFSDYRPEEPMLFMHEALRFGEVKSVIISCVTDPPLGLVNFFKENFSVTEFSHLTPLPISNLYQTPETLGKDRIAAIVAAVAIFPEENLLVIDAGTCITYDYFDKKKGYLGGGISPGIYMRLKALHTFTGKLPFIEPESSAPLIGTTTRDSILSGVINGVVAETEGIIEMYKSHFQTLRCIITGGDMNFFVKNLKNSNFAAQNLVLQGLNEILLFNEK